MSMHAAIQAFQLAEQGFGERMVARGALFDPALGVEAGLLAALPHLQRVACDSVEPVAQAKVTGLSLCPFCGGRCEMLEGRATEDVWPHGTFHRVFCTSCQARQLFHKTPEEAAAAWDRRTARPRAVPDGYVLVPRELTPEMAAEASVAVWPVATAADRAKASDAALILLTATMTPMPGATLEGIAAAIATMFPAYRAMIAAAPQPGESA